MQSWWQAPIILAQELEARLLIVRLHFREKEKEMRDRGRGRIKKRGEMRERGLFKKWAFSLALDKFEAKLPWMPTQLHYQPLVLQCELIYVSIHLLSKTVTQDRIIRKRILKQDTICLKYLVEFILKKMKAKTNCGGICL